MSSPSVFRELRRVLVIVQVEVQLLLGVPGIEWPNSDYALFLAMGELSRKVKNPTRKQMLTHLGAWLRFYKRLIDTLPEDNPLKVTGQVEFNKVSEPYKGLFEAKT